MSDEFSKIDKINKKPYFVKGSILGIIVSVLFMLLFSVVLLVLNLDRAYSAPFATVSAAAGTLAASHYAAKKIGDRGYLTGLIIGLIVFVVITALSLILGNSLSVNTLFHFIIIVLSGIIGGIMGVNRERSKKYI